jgi:hypothetical protein
MIVGQRYEHSKRLESPSDRGRRDINMKATTMHNAKAIVRLFIVLFAMFALPNLSQAQCANWNESIDPTTGQPFNTIESPPGTVIGVANTQTSVAETFDGIPLSQTGVQCVTKGEEVYHPDDLETPLETEDDEDEDGDGIPDICGIVPGLLICNQNNNNGGNNGNGGNGGQSSMPKVFTSNPAETGNGDGKGADLTVVAGPSGDRMRCDGGKRNCEHTNLGAGLGQELRNAYDRAPQLIDRRKLEENTLDMISEDSAREDGGKRPSLGRALNYSHHTKIKHAESLSVDDEVLKTAMAVFTPVRRLRGDFLNDANSRDAYLDSALTLRGVTVMAMGFLDKTLGAGLHALDQQATANINVEMMKQLNWTTTRLANQEREEVMRDVDMKVEACLEAALGSGAAPKQVDTGTTTRKWVWTEECSQECGEKPNPNTTFKGSTERISNLGNGTFAYCVCCAETAKNLNQLHANGERPRSLRQSGNQLWTLVERAFYGVKSSDNGDPSMLDDRVEAFKLLFGDVVLKPVKAGGAQGDEEGFFHFANQMPKASPRKLTAMFKNLCKHGDGQLLDLSEPGSQSACHLNAKSKFKINCGICPAAIDIMKNWDGVLDGSYTGGKCGDLEQTWMEATMGHPFTGREVKQFLLLNGDPNANLKEPKEIAARVIESWCEASAVAATSRLYASMKTVAADHVTLSNALTTRQKAQFIALTDRWGETMNMAQLDANSKLASMAVLTGTSIFYDRERAAMTASSQVAMSARATESAQFAGMLVLGGSGLSVDGGQ